MDKIDFLKSSGGAFECQGLGGLLVLETLMCLLLHIRLVEFSMCTCIAWWAIATYNTVEDFPKWDD